MTSSTPPVVPPPVKSGTALGALRRRWLRRGVRVLWTTIGAVFLLVTGVPALAFWWGAVEARIDIERGRPELLTFGRPDFSAPQVDPATGLRWRSQGCSVDPVSSLHAQAYNQVMRGAAGRGEVSTLRHLVRERRELAALFDGGGGRVPTSGAVDVAATVRIRCDGSVVTIVGPLGRERQAYAIDPSRGDVDVDVVLDATGELVVFRFEGPRRRCATDPSPGSGGPHYHYHTYSVSRGEPIQRSPRW